MAKVFNFACVLKTFQDYINLYMRKSYIYFLFVLAFAMAMASCGSSYKINGATDVSLLDGQKFYMQTFVADEMKPIDSCEVVHGQFAFAGTTDTVKIAYITNEANALPIILEEGEIKVSINMTGEEVSGTELNDKFSEFRKSLVKIDGAIEDLSHRQSQGIMNGEDEDSLNTILNQKFQLLLIQKDSLATKFICNNFDNVLAAAAFQFLTIQAQMPQMSPWVEDILSKATDDFKNDPYVKMYLEQARLIEGLENGTVEMPSQQNTTEDVPADYEGTIPTQPSQVPTPNDLAAPVDSTAK